MQRGRLIAIVVGIAITVAFGAAFAFTSISPGTQDISPGTQDILSVTEDILPVTQDEVKPAGTKEGRNIVVNIQEELGVSESP